jgi:hypothetical protein
VNRPEILETAKGYVTADRNATHGDPEDNFRTIAEYWEAYLRSKGMEDVEIRTYDVAAMMVLMKVSRLATSPGQEDHWVDIAGYAACGGEVATRVADRG